MNDPRLDKLLQELESMSPGEYQRLYNQATGIEWEKLPKSNFTRLMQIHSCKECLELKKKYMSDEDWAGVDYCYECISSRKKTSVINGMRGCSEQSEIELYEMFESCEILKKG